MHQVLLRKTDRIKLKFESLLLLHPGRRVAEYSHRLSQLYRSLSVAGGAGLRFYRHRLEGCMGKLRNLSPLAVLERGYSIAQLLPSKEIIRRSSQLKVEDRVNVRVRQGEFIARVKEVKQDKKN